MNTHPTFKTLLLLVLLVAAGGLGQQAKAQEDITLRLRTMLNYYPVQCDSIVVLNTTQGTSTTLYYPDTILSNHTVGIGEWTGANKELKMGVLTANPYQDRVEVLLTLPRTETVELILCNGLGQMEWKKSERLPAGKHRLVVRTGAAGLHILSAHTSTDRCSVKLMQEGGSCGSADITCSSVGTNDFVEKRLNAARSQFDFAVGDHLTLTTYANAHYYDTITPIQQTVGLTVSESGTVNFKSFRTFEPDSILNKDSINLRNTIWDVVASGVFNFYECLGDFATDMGEEVESQITFYDSTFCSIRHSGICDAELYGGQYHIGSPWIYNNYPSFNGKYRMEYDVYPEYNVIRTNLYVGPMDSLCSNLTYHYQINYMLDYNILDVFDATRGIDAIDTAYYCYFRRKGRVE